MQRIQIYIDDDTGRGLRAEAERRGMSMSAVIRERLAGVTVPAAEDPWDLLTGFVHGEPIDDLDAVIYEHPA